MKYYFDRIKTRYETYTHNIRRHQRSYLKSIQLISSEMKEEKTIKKNIKSMSLLQIPRQSISGAGKN